MHQLRPAARTEPLRMRYTNRLNPENNRIEVYTYETSHYRRRRQLSNVAIAVKSTAYLTLQCKSSVRYSGLTTAS